MDRYQEILKQYWGYDDFRGIQREIIESIGSGHDTLGLMPTGGGKSITFQVPALAQEGTCIVITPLIALMKDQVDNLRRKGIKAAAIYSGLTHEEIIITLENAIFGAVKLLYVSPERLSSELFQTKLRHMKVSFITVDEAHCISQWGYDFRPSYLQIAQIRKLVPDVPVLALTATATPQVVDDIQERLKSANLEDNSFNVFKMSFERKNLAYVVRHAEASGLDPQLNSRNFTVETSLDGETWTTAGTYVDNTAPVTEATITPIEARYVRVNVTNGGADGYVRIGDIEVYGAHSLQSCI